MTVAHDAQRAVRASADDYRIPREAAKPMPDSYRILHVEDSSDDSELVRLALRNAPFGFTYDLVDAEADYVARLDLRVPDVILCDYDLPHFNAERALAILGERGLDIPFVIISQHIGESAAVIAMQRGASDYLPKRDLVRLSKAIENAMEHRKVRAEKARAQEQLRASESMRRSIVNALGERIALIDGRGVILAVNKAWEEFGAPRAKGPVRGAVVGDNYLGLLEERGRGGTPEAGTLLAGIRAVAVRERRFFSHEYEIAVGESNRWYRTNALPLEGIELGAVITHGDITDRMMSHVALSEAHRRLQNLSKRVLSVQEEERRNISRDLHDDIGQSLTALKIGLHRLPHESPSSQADIVAECVSVADSTLDKLRDLALELRPPQLDQLGLADALGWLVERQRAATGLDIQCVVTGLEVCRPPAALETTCYRIAQEALNNATRHAKAKRIVVTVECDGPLLKLAVQDDGAGFDAETARMRSLQSGSLGLISMDERAQLAGGRLKVRTVVGGGTTVTVMFPIEAREAPHESAEAAQSL
jgi:two-component system, NarL family, sensor histidine kinase UhpB